VKRHDYLPFGEELFAGAGSRTVAQGYAANDGVRQQFTAKERDIETGLDYFEARYYASTQGRFTSPDEFSNGPEQLFYFEQAVSENPTFYAELEEPQTLNKYQYAINNPLRYVDPDGHQAVADALKVAAAGGAASGNPAVAGGALVVLVVYVAVDQTVGWQKVGDTFVNVFKGSSSGCVAGAVVCGPGETPNSPVQYQQNNSSNTDAQQGQSGETQKSGQTAEKTKNLADAEKKGIPKSQLGPSGRPKVHVVKHPTEKRAKDAARSQGQGAPAKDASPKKGDSHYHPTNPDGSRKKGKQNVHHEYPK
jgi:RHS repeat-associated protein